MAITIAIAIVNFVLQQFSLNSDNGSIKLKWIKLIDSLPLLEIKEKNRA